MTSTNDAGDAKIPPSRAPLLPTDNFGVPDHVHQGLLGGLQRAYHVVSGNNNLPQIGTTQWAAAVYHDLDAGDWRVDEGVTLAFVCAFTVTGYNLRETAILVAGDAVGTEKVCGGLERHIVIASVESPVGLVFATRDEAVRAAQEVYAWVHQPGGLLEVAAEAQKTAAGLHAASLKQQRNLTEAL